MKANDRTLHNQHFADKKRVKGFKHPHTGEYSQQLPTRESMDRSTLTNIVWPNNLPTRRESTNSSNTLYRQHLPTRESNGFQAPLHIVYSQKFAHNKRVNGFNHPYTIVYSQKFAPLTHPQEESMDSSKPLAHWLAKTNWPQENQWIPFKAPQTEKTSNPSG
jgi:hypothetical protein